MQHFLLVVIVTFYSILLWSLLVSVHRCKPGPRGIQVVDYQDCKQNIGSGDLLLTRSMSLFTFMVEKHFLSWYSHVAMVICLEDKPQGPLFVMEVFQPVILFQKVTAVSGADPLCHYMIGCTRTRSVVASLPGKSCTVAMRRALSGPMGCSNCKMKMLCVGWSMWIRPTLLF